MWIPEREETKMATMRTVTLELLRHGPPHNQLLSRLTQYLGLCGNHPAVTVNVPLDQAQFLVKLQALQYKDTNKTLDLQIQDTADKMTDILASVPGLIAELSECCEGGEREMTHLRLILSANELALLPFELANAPNGFPGAGQSLLLQSQLPLSITREGRRVSSRFGRWGRTPKILFASASPPGVDSVPRDAHALALRYVIEPWVYYHADDEQRERRVGEHLTVLTDASVDSIHKACSSGEYTHVHILAHGVPYEQGDDRRYGLALHSAHNAAQKDVVDGPRLAAALRPHTDCENDNLTCPTVVTIASCEGAQGGTVVGAGASIAHALHEAGIPLVVGSQFPLSFAASVVMVQVLYTGLLNGGDPRRLLNDLRRQLKSRVPATHDWASIVAYAAFPDNLTTQLSQVRVDQAKRSIEAALDHADTLSRRMSKRYSSMSKNMLGTGSGTGTGTGMGIGTGTGTGSGTGSGSAPLVQQVTATLRALKEPQERLKKAQHRLEELLNRSYPDEGSIYGLLASTQKRLAEILWRAVSISVSGVSIEQRSEHQQQAIIALRASREFYWKAFQINRAQSWGLVQHLALVAVLHGGNKVDPDEWRLAKLLSEQDLNVESRERRTWARANLIELYLLAMMRSDGVNLIGNELADMKVREYRTQFLKLADPHSWEIHSTRRQLVRYLEFFNEVQPDVAIIIGLVEEILGSLEEVISLS
jgi:hypothetical protein